MNKKVYIIHGWDGYPEEGWFPWLKMELEKKGIQVYVPQMPKPEEPRINNWVPYLKEIISNSDSNTYFIGHSIGCQAVVRYLESLGETQKIGGAVFVAGFFKRLTNIEKDDISSSVVSEWLGTPINFDNVKKCINKSIAIFSDDDPYVPIDNQDEFRSMLNSEIIIEHNKGHFSGTTGTVELPIVLDSILKII